MEEKLCSMQGRHLQLATNHHGVIRRGNLPWVFLLAALAVLVCSGRPGLLDFCPNHPKLATRGKVNSSQRGDPSGRWHQMFQDLRNELGPQNSPHACTGTASLLSTRTTGRLEKKENFEKRKQDFRDFFKKHPHILRNERGRVNPNTSWSSVYKLQLQIGVQAFQHQK